MSMDRRPAQSALSHWRAALLGGTALVRVGLAAVTVSGALATLIVTTPAALADGGRGGGGPTGIPGGGDSATATGGTGSGGIVDITITSGGGGGGAGVTGGVGGAGYGGRLGGAGGSTPGVNGADGTDVISSLNGGGGGGGGAHGAVISASGALSAGIGGNGGHGGGFSVGGPYGLVGGGGGGGAGGYATVITGAGLSLTNSANLIGGNGGAGGRGGHGGGSGGNGGSGGIGLDFVTTSNVLLNGGFIAGGAGGAGGVGQGLDVNGGNGGNGGAGIVASGLVVTSTGAITGGSGGAAGTAAFGIEGQAGVGGVGLIGANISVINGGTITGGMSGDGATQANAITFTGGANTLRFLNGMSGLNGNIGVTGSLTLDQNGIDATVANIITGSGRLIKTGSAMVALSGINAYSRGTTINAGTLRVDNNTALGTGAVTLAGGTLLGGGAGVTLSNDVKFNDNTTSTISAGATTMTLAGGMTLGSTSIARFGVAGDTGTIGAQFSGVGISIAADGPTIEINGGTVRALTTGFAFATVNAFSTSVAAGAVFDLNDQVDPWGGDGIRRLLGAGTVHIGSNSATILNIAGGDFSGAITGAGGLRISNVPRLSSTHLLTLSGTSSYAGPTTIDAGNTLQLGDGGTAGAIGTGAVNNSGTLAFNRSNAFNFANTISGSGELRQQGAGITTLSGINTYTGATTVNAGTLAIGPGGSIVSDTTVNGGTFSVNGTAAGVTVNAGAMLGGNGTVGNTLINGGTLSPGNSIGALTVAGNLVLTAASTYMVEVSPSNADFTHVTGTATLNGARVAAQFASGRHVEKRYTILTADGGVNGTFSGPVNTNLPTNFKTALAHDGNNAFLDLKLVYAPPGGPLNVNQSNVANTLTNFFNSTGGIPLAFGALTPQGLTQVSGEFATGTQQATFGVMNLFMGVMTDPFMAGRGDGIPSSGGVPAFAADDHALGYASRGDGRNAAERNAYAAMARKALPTAPSFEQRWSVWAAGYGGSQTTSGNSVVGSNTATSSLYGVAVGADYRLSLDTLVGFAMTGGATGFNIANGLGSGRSDLFQAGAFVRHHIGNAYLSGALAYGWQDVSTDRTVIAGGVERLRANFNANAFSGRLEGGYRIATPMMGLTPYAAGQFTTYDLPAYAEQSSAGSLFALNYAAKNVTASRSELGLRTDKSFALNDTILTLRSRAAWAHNFDTDRSIAATFQSLPGASFVVNGAAQAANAALLTGSAEMKWANGFALAATFEGEFSDTTESYAGKGVVRYSW